MDFMDLATAVSALMLVLLLIVGLGWALQRTGLIHGLGSQQRASRNNRLCVMESIPLDPRRRLVIVRRDDHEHLIILGHNGEREIGQSWPCATATEPPNDSASDGKTTP